MTATRRREITKLVIFSVVPLLGIYIGRVTAEGIPANPPMYYSGILEESGDRPNGTRKIKVGLYPSDGGGTAVCETASVSTNVIAGEFRVALPGGCADAVKVNSDIWVRVTVDDMYSLPYTKLGAVPYAVAAARADMAVIAGGAEAASGPLDARIASVEKVSGGAIGDVRASMLTLAQFGEEVGSGWVLADGAGYPTSRYAAITGRPHVPDLGGQFLRGLDEDQNIDPGRTLDGTPQGDAIQNHTHTRPGMWAPVGYVRGRVAAGGGNGTGNSQWEPQWIETGRVASETRPTNVAVNFFIKIN